MLCCTVATSLVIDRWMTTCNLTNEVDVAIAVDEHEELANSQLREGTRVNMDMHTALARVPCTIGRVDLPRLELVDVNRQALR